MSFQMDNYNPGAEMLIIFVALAIGVLLLLIVGSLVWVGDPRAG